MLETNPNEGALGGLRGNIIFGSLPAKRFGPDARLEVLVAGAASFTPAVRLTPLHDRLQFEIDLPESLRDGQIRLIDVRVMGEAGPLGGGPLIFDGGLFDNPFDHPAAGDAGDEAEGHVEFDGGSRLSGWARSPRAPDATLTVEVWSGHQLIAAVAADQPTEGAIREGPHGFSIDLARWLRGGPHSLEVCVEGSRAPLPGGLITVAKLVKDGVLSGDDYLEDAKSAELLAALPLEQFAYGGARMSEARLVPRLVNRLKRERAALPDTRGTATLVLLGRQDTNSLPAQLWRRQSYRRIGLTATPETPAELRQMAAGAAFVFFAGPEDMLHPSAASLVMSEPDCDAVVWHRFCGQDARAGAPGDVWRRPLFDPATWRHGAVTDTTLALRGQVLVDCPDEVAIPLLAGRLHPLFFWLAGRELRWRTHAEALTSQVGEFRTPDREEILTDWNVYEDLLSAEGEAFSLSESPTGHPFPFVLVPTRRAAKTSVLICYRDRSEITLRAVHSLSRQHLTGELELVLVDNQSSPAEARRVVEGATTILGRERVVALAYDGPFNHSAQNNLAARAATGEVVVICNNDVVVDDPLCIEQLSAWALQPGVGVVGCRLEDPDRSRASFGHGFRPITDDPFRAPLQESADPTYGLYVHACPGVTLALGALSRERFLDLGGLDEVRYPIGHNDTDFMLRSAERGLTHLYLGHVWGTHARGSSRTGDDEDRQTLSLNQRYGGVLSRRFVQLGREVVGGRPDPAPRGSRPAPPPKAAPSEPELPEADLQALLAAHRNREAARLSAVLAGGGAAAILDRAPKSGGRSR